MNDTITTVASNTLDAFSAQGIIGLILFVVGVAIISVVWIAIRITNSDSRRDVANADISNRQLQIMADQQVEFAKLNSVVAVTLNNNNQQFADIARNSEKLNQILESIQATQELERVAIMDNRVEIRKDFNVVLEKLERQEKALMEITKNVNDFRKDFSEILPKDFIAMLSLWQTAITKSFSEVQLLIKEVATIQREKEAERESREYVEREMDDLFGRS